MLAVSRLALAKPFGKLVNNHLMGVLTFHTAVLFCPLPAPTFILLGCRQEPETFRIWFCLERTELAAGLVTALTAGLAGGPAGCGLQVHQGSAPIVPSPV